MSTEPRGSAAPTGSRWRWLKSPRGETVAATAFFLLLTLAVFAPVLFGPGDQILGDADTDLRKQFVDWRGFGFGQMAAGHFPLWNPHIYGGTQYFGGFQSALLYPPNWLYLCLPLPRAINLGIALHFFLGGWFLFFWVRHRGLHPFAAGLAGAMFVLGGAYFPHVFAGHLPNLCTMGWGPLILLAIDGWFSRGTLPWLLLGGGALAMQILAGHPQYVFYTGIACALYGVTPWWFARHRWWTALGLLVIPAVGMALSAVQLFEGLHASGESLRSKGLTVGFAGSFSFPPENFLTFIVPGFFGNGVTGSYWGRHYLWETCPFIGISGVVLALYALFAVRNRQVWTCAGVAVVLFALALGRYTPLFEPLYHHAPGFNKFRGWSKFIYPATLFVVMLAATGFDALLRRKAAPLALGVTLLGCALALGSAGLWADWSAHLGSADSPEPWESWLQGTLYTGESINTAEGYLEPPSAQAAARFAAGSLWIAAASCLALGAAFFAGRRWRAALFVVPAIAVAELLVFALPLRVTFDDAPARRGAVARFLASHPPGDGRLLDLEDANGGMTSGEDDLWGYDPGVNRRYAELFAVTQQIGPEDATQDLQFHQEPDLYATLLRCRAVFGLSHDDDEEIVPHVFDPALVAPHVMLVPQVQVIAKADAILQAMVPPFDPRATVILESPPEPPPAEHPAPGKATVTAETTDSLTIEADLPDAAVLVITDTYSDGWQARSLLRPSAGSAQTVYHVMPADYCVRAIPLASGHHRFLLEYRPAAFLIGAWVSAISVLLYAVAVGRVLRSRRRAADSTGFAAVTSRPPAAFSPLPAPPVRADD